MRLSFIAVLVALLTSGIFAQENLPEYMDNTLIIKFKNARAATEYRAKSIPEASLFVAHNVNANRSIWKDEFSNRIRNNMILKGKVAELPSFDHLKNIYQFEFNSDIDAITLANKISRLPGVEYAEPRYLYKTTLNTFDPIQNDYVTFHNFDKAWDISTSSSDVIIAIVDSGVNYDHEDLRDKQWVNENEIPNNGTDDDNNGFIDDYLGWDFWERGYTNATITQDNDPFAGNNPHGTHVAGIATATPDNGSGLAGAGFNARFMAVKAGGPPDDPSTPSDESRSVGFGYEGILYAALNGADIINCSWGGSGYSAFGEDIVNTVTELGALVISSAGNDATDRPGYPASLDNVLSVGALGTNGNIIADYSTFGLTVDVFATGTIQSSVGTSRSSTSEYATFQGTSMSSPVVSGLAALIRTHYPDWSPERIKLQIRSTSISIEEDNEDRFALKLGKGSIDAEKALLAPVPGVKIDSVSFLNENGTSLNVNEEGVLKLSITNYGATVNNLTLNIESLNDNLTFDDADILIGSLDNNGRTEIDIPITFDERILQNLNVQILVQLTNGVDYSDFDVLSYDRLQFDVTDVNNVAMSFSPTGNIGFYDATNSSGGVGFVPNPETADFVEDNLLYEGGILLEINQLLANTVRTSSDLPPDRDFRPVSLLSIVSPGSVSDADGSTTFAPIEKTGINDTEVTLNTYAFNSANLSNAVLLNYVIKNLSRTLSFSDVYLGIFNDWDIGNFANNSVYYNQANDILIVKEEDDSTHPLASVATMANTSSVLAIDNGFSGTESDFQFSLFDGYTFAEKRNSLRAGTNNTEVSRKDISSVVASGPYFIEPGDSVSLGFIYAFGNTEQELIDQINAARSLDLFDLSDINNDPQKEFPSETELFQNFPNPFNPSTTFTFNLNAISDVELSIYNLLGQKIETVINGRLQGGIHSYTVSLDQYSSGIYFGVLETRNRRELIKLTLIK